MSRVRETEQQRKGRQLPQGTMVHSGKKKKMKSGRKSSHNPVHR